MYYDSHHDELEPRSIPKPTQFQEISAKPEVPELSIVFETNSSVGNSNLSSKSPSYATSQATRETYNEWKNKQNHLPIHKETRYYEPRDRHYNGSSPYNDCDQNPYSRYSDKVSYKSNSEYHKCACQNTPTVKDIYNMMQIQSDQMKFLLETIQKLLVTVLSNQQNPHKCCCFENNQCKKSDDFKAPEFFKNMNDSQEKCQLQNYNDNNTEKQQTNVKTDDVVQDKTEQNIKSKCSIKQNITSVKNKPKNSKVYKCDKNNDEKDIKEKETICSALSDESFEINANDVQVIEAPISPEQSIHIEMKSSSEDSSNSECEEASNQKIEVGWTMYKNIIGQVNNLLEENKNELKSTKTVECVKTTPITKPKNFESYKHFILPENNKIDSSLQMQALAMQYLSPEQAVKFDINKHIPTTQPTVKSPNNYSISTMHYMERYHLIGAEPNYTSESPQLKLSTDGLINKKKKSTRKNKTSSKVLNITELKQQPKLS